MKKVILLLVCAVLVFAGCSFAEVKKFKDISADVPAGWTTNDDGEGVVFTSPNGAAAVTITFAPHEGASAKEIVEDYRANALYWQLKCQEPKPIDNPKGFVFEYTNAAGVKGVCFVSTDENNFLVITGIGEDPGMDAIVDSIKPNK